MTVPALPEIDPVIGLEKVLFPEKVFEFASNVDEAAVTVIFAVPSNDVPFIVRAV